ncbi:tRNA 2-thiouridine(34) synthase MnmA [Candidatus Saccharibacteria bacterium RIFCSPHIGHO2_12_FULL_47_16b]|nr:MAG: tRNA 2-thiouridine(34) synthase MnmA [Candidatus Saccharibacteria bacterium RIFCSPHIGHO2_12_FULL_47_16b]
METVFVGMSGGVDSSVAAMLLKQRGYKVVGVFMKNWSQDLPGMPCPWREDFADAKRVAVQLGIDFKMYDFEKEYKDKVVDYMLKEFKAGHTPNPDIMCNQEIKFGLFFHTAMADGADYIATGHYAKTKNGKLFMAKDKAKDQTYFLYRATESTLKKTLYPIGDYLKSEVRVMATKHKLVTADKKESMGLCFVGKVGIKEFLSQYVKSKAGPIIDQKGNQIGEHDGAIFYTIGQRHGLDIGGGLPYYVTGKDMKKNEVYVTTDLQDEKLWSRIINFTNAHWINQPPADSHQSSVISHQSKTSRLETSDKRLFARTRHRGELIKVKKLNPSTSLRAGKSTQWTVELKDDVRAVTPGQSIVFYCGNQCLGGGIVS